MKAAISIPSHWRLSTEGALERSTDAGRTWARVTVKAGDVVLDSDIVRVEFTDAQHGALMTVSGETWTTSDAGLTWSVRR